MTTIPNIALKRERLPRRLVWDGASSLLSRLPARDSLLVLNYHRIGNEEDDMFDPCVFSATAEQFEDQIAALKRHVSPVTLEEGLAFIDGTLKEKTPRCRVLITFDDGYLDNYRIAYPILRSHGVQGVFFLVTSMVGSGHIPWWDQISYLMKTGKKRKFCIRYPEVLKVDIDRDSFKESLRAVLRLFKRPENADPERFLQELAEETQGQTPPKTLRRFLNWDEAREMNEGGAVIGSHTHSHHVLSQLDPERQYEELSKSRAILKEQLGVEIDALAYPVGKRDSFTDETQRIAHQVGYRAAFSFHGGANLRGKTLPYNISRFDLGEVSVSRLQLEMAVWKLTGRVRWS
jgi:peptidoglycan/xylan/chitin deacetylase (PgdA/CDA1 family)